MNKKLKIVCTLVLCFTIIFSGNVFASNENQDFTVTYKSKEVTDVAELIKIGVEDNTSKFHNELNINEKSSNKVLEFSNMQNNDDNQFQVKQLLEERVYSNGSIERSYVSKGIKALDTNGIPINVQSLPSSPVSGTTTRYGTTVTCSLYFTAKSTNKAPVFRVDQVKTTICNNYTTNVVPVSGSHIYTIHQNNHSSNSASFSCNANTVQTFTLYSAHSGFYVSSGGYVEVGTCAQSCVNLSDGSDIAVLTGIDPKGA